MNVKRLLGFVATAALSVGTLAACSGNSSSSESDSNVLKIGVMSRSDADVAKFDKIQEILGDEVKLEFTEFTDYSQPNLALANGEVDINAFQHINFLNNWNEENDGDLISIAYTVLSPIRLYSGTSNGENKYTSVDEIPDGAEIAVPNDATNESRALYLLQSAGLITLDVSGTELATIVNIKDNPKNLKITELDAAQTPASLTSVDAAVVNNNYAVEAKLDYKNPLYKEQKDANSEQWYNIIAANKDWESSDKADLIKKFIEAYHSDEVKKVIEEESDGLDEPVW